MYNSNPSSALILRISCDRGSGFFFLVFLLFITETITREILSIFYMVTCNDFDCGLRADKIGLSVHGILGARKIASDVLIDTIII